MYLSYSGFQKYSECPLQYYHQYIAKTPVPTPDNRVGSLFGSTVGRLFETFYEDRLWRAPNPEKLLLERSAQELRKVMDHEKKRGGVFLWKGGKSETQEKESKDYKSPNEVLVDVREAVTRGLVTIKRHWLLGKDARAEVKLDNQIRGHTLAGRLDFVMNRAAPLGDLVILDGKGSKYRDRYTSSDQLYWYAMLYRSHHQRLPDRMGFVFWKSEPEQAVDWFPGDANRVDGLEASAFATIAQIEKAKKSLPLIAFNAKPTTSKCNLCPYLFTCKEGQTITSKEKVDLSDGVEDFGL